VRLGGRTGLSSEAVALLGPRGWCAAGGSTLWCLEPEPEVSARGRERVLLEGSSAAHTPGLGGLSGPLSPVVAHVPTQ